MADPAAPHLRHACPLQAAEAALLLLDRGRTDMARLVVEGLPGLLLRAERERLEVERDELKARLASAEASLAQRRALLAQVALLSGELAELRAQRVADLQAALGVARKAAAKRPAQRPAQRRAKPHQALAAALASGTATAERVARLLKVAPSHVNELAAGRVGLASSAWKKVFSEMEVSIP